MQSFGVTFTHKFHIINMFAAANLQTVFGNAAFEHTAYLQNLI
jgi:hypothetical protein